MRNSPKFIIAVILAIFLASTTTFAQSKPREERLLNGLKLLMWRDASANDVNIRIRIHSGAAFDPQGKEGVMRLLADNVFPTEATREFFTEELGGDLVVTTNYDFIEINARGRSDALLTMIETLSAAVANPTIDKPTTARLKEALTAQVKVLEADPSYVASLAANKRLFGAFPYGRPIYGSAESIAKVDFADLINARERFLTADNATVAISGNFDASFAYKAFRRLFGAWLKSDRKIPPTFRQPDDPPPGMLTIPSPVAETSSIRFATRGISRADSNFATSKVYAALLESRMRARVPSIFADKIVVRSVEHTLPGVFTIGFSANRNDIGTGNGKIEANELVAKALADPITDAEFQAARSAFSAEWTKVDMVTHWLDADTFKLADAAAQARAADSVTIDMVRAFAERIAKAPKAVVLVNTPN